MSLPPPEPEAEENKISTLNEVDSQQSPADDEVISTLNASFKTEEFHITKSDGSNESNGFLNAPFRGPIRPLSPDTLSNLSADDHEQIRPSRSREQAFDGYRLPSRSPAPPRGFKVRAKASWKRNKGLFYMLCAQVFGTLMNVTTRLLEVEGNKGKGLHPFQIIFARMSITFVLASGYMWYKKTPHFPLGVKEVRWLLAARGFGGFFGLYGIYYSLLYLPLADATVITFLAPGLACWACSFLINEPFTRVEQIAGFISLLGVVLIARPTSFFSTSSDPVRSAGETGDTILGGNVTIVSPSASSYANVTPSERLGAVGIALTGVLGAAVAYTTIRWIGKRAHPLISVNYFAAWGTFVAFVMQLALPGVGFLLPSDLKEWGYLIFLGTCGFIMQLLLAAGLAYEKSSRATNMIYTQMLFALAFDKIFFGTTPGWLSIIGSSLILGSAIYVAVQKDTKKSKDNTGGHRLAGDEENQRGLMSGMHVEEGEDHDRIPIEEVQLRMLR